MNRADPTKLKTSLVTRLVPIFVGMMLIQSQPSFCADAPEAATPIVTSQNPDPANLPSLCVWLETSKSRNEKLPMVAASFPNVPGLTCDSWCYESDVEFLDARAIVGGGLELRHRVRAQPQVVLVTTVTPEPGAVEVLARAVLDKERGGELPANLLTPNLCWQLRRAASFKSKPDPYPDFIKRCFIFTESGRTFLDHTTRRKIPVRGADDPYNNPPWVQMYVGTWQEIPQAGTNSWADYSPDRYTTRIIGTISRDGKYLAALANDSAATMCQAWHDCLHNNPQWTSADAPPQKRVWRLKVYAMANDPQALRARVDRDFPNAGQGSRAADDALIARDASRRFAPSSLGTNVVAGPANSICVIPLKPDPPPAVDGQLNEWLNRPGALVLDRREQATWGGNNWKSAADLCARVWLAWRSDTLYLAASVKDDQLRQSQRGHDLWRGDHVMLFLDATPDDAPQQDVFGRGQFQIGFSPGNFLRTGDAGVDCPPEIYCYRPAGARLAGATIAATQTPAGYDLEVSLPWAQLGVASPQAGMALRLEVAVSDTDGAEPRQEKMMTSSTKEWEITRSRLTAAALGDTSGRAVESAAGKPLFGELRLPNGASATNQLIVATLPADREAVLALKARMQFDAPAGHTPALEVRVNGRVLNSARLLNKPQFGKANDGRIHPLAAGERFSTFYAPDFTSADGSQYGIPSVKTSEFELRLTGLLHAGTNELVIVNAAQTSVTQAMVVADARLVFRDVGTNMVARSGPPTGALEVFKPVASHRVNYTARELPDSRLEIELNGERFVVESEFSTPAPSWERGSNKFFGHRRTIEKREEAIIVSDTFTNLTSENLPVMQRHQARATAGSLKHIWLAGLSPAGLDGSSASPENPTTFGVTEKGGLGLLALNDEFLVHVANYASDGLLGLADRQFVLRPGARCTAEWAIVPVERPDYFDFVNAVRRLREVNFTIRDSFAFLRAGPPVREWSDAAFTNFARFKSVNLLCATIDWPLHNGLYPHGTAFQKIERGHFKVWADRIRRLLPGVQSSVYFHCFIDVMEDSPQRFADARVLRSDGSQADYGTPGYKIFFPTATNGFGRAAAGNVDLMFDEIGVDGVYWDEMEYSAYQYHYGEPWDGCSADIDSRTHRITRLKSSVALVSQDWRVALAKRILARGPLIANGQPHTRTVARLKFPRFVETGSPSHCTGAQMFSPIALGDHLTERGEEDAYRMMLIVLDYGCLYHWYNDLTVIPTHRTLTEHMYPITPMELHEGWIVGQERIITKRSGLFGWGDQSRHEVHAYDEHGREMTNFKSPLVKRGEANFSELRLAEGWSAVVIRK